MRKAYDLADGRLVETLATCAFVTTFFKGSRGYQNGRRTVRLSRDEAARLLREATVVKRLADR